LFDWQPTVQLRQGLEHTIAYFREGMRNDVEPVRSASVAQ
jgi:hypothetical protein